MTTEVIKIDDLTPYERNARHHEPVDIDAIAKSIEAFGFNDPVGVWGPKNVIVEGHGRVMAAKQLGMTEVPCIRLDDLTDEQRRAYGLAHNKTAELSTWDAELLPLEVQDLPMYDMTQFGFNDAPAAGSDKDPEVVDDDFDEEADEVEAQTKPGDLWQLGVHRLLCGDSTDPEAIDKLLDGVKAELLLTDPPYGISVVHAAKVGGGRPSALQKPDESRGGGPAKGIVGFGEAGKNKIVNCTEYRPIIGDDTTETARANYDAAADRSKNQIIFGGNYFTDFLPPSRCWVVWDKQNTGNFADAELAWTSFDRGVRLYHFLWNGLCRAGSRDIEGKTRVHPTQKPVGMLGDILKDFTKEGEIVLDCFGGSGSTLIACEQLGRKCRMIELDPHYCDVIIARWEKLTGKKAELIRT